MFGWEWKSGGMEKKKKFIEIYSYTLIKKWLLIKIKKWQKKKKKKKKKKKQQQQQQQLLHL